MITGINSSQGEAVESNSLALILRKLERLSGIVHHPRVRGEKARGFQSLHLSLLRAWFPRKRSFHYAEFPVFQGVTVGTLGSSSFG